MTGRVIKPPVLPMLDFTERDAWERAAKDERRRIRTAAIMRAVLDDAGTSAADRVSKLERGARIYRIMCDYLYSFAVALALELEEKRGGV